MRLFSVDELVALLADAGFTVAGFASTLIRSSPGAPRPESPQACRVDDAGFVGVLAVKPGAPAAQQL